MTSNKIRRTEIQIETHEVKVIRLRGKQFSIHCQHCQTTVAAFTLEQTATFFQKTVGEVCALAEAGEFHLAGTEHGLSVVCGNSLGNENKVLMLNA